MRNPLQDDLDFIFQHTTHLWDHLRNQRIFVTGGTGFFGKWLLESFAFVNRHLQLNASMTVLTRNPEVFAQHCPHLSRDASIIFLQGDVRHFAHEADRFSYIIHGATDASASLNAHDPQRMFDTIVEGTTNMLAFARKNPLKHFLHISSGAIYGKQPETLTHLDEDYQRLNDLDSAYASGKLAAEQLCHAAALKYNLNIKIARCFAFVGPYLPLDIHFAIGNFIRDALQGKPIQVKGDGTPFRSYLYAADLAIWLWTILFLGERMRPYNVGSDEALQIADVASIVANEFEGTSKIEIAKTPDLSILPERYVPCISRVKTELGLLPRISLVDAVKKTVAFLKKE